MRGLLEHLRKLRYNPVFRPSRWIGDMQFITGIKNYNRRLDAFIKQYKDGIRILDMGSGNRKLSRKTLSFDLIKSPKVDVVGDAASMPFENGSFGACVIQEVLEHLKAPHTVLIETRRVLKSRGEIYVSVPFLMGVHGEFDFSRFTLNGLENLIKEHFEIVESGVSIGRFSALNKIALDTIYSVFQSRKVLRALIGSLLQFLTFWIKYIDIFIPTSKESKVAGGYYVIARKR